MDMLGWLLALAAPAVGSFAALLADRLAEGRDPVAARSRCDGCGRRLGALELVPILSWLALRGMSRCCGRPIPVRLLGAELAALGLTLWALAVVPEPLWPASALLGWTLLALALIDLRTFRLPDPGTLGLVLAGLALSAAGATGPLALHAAGAALGYLALAGLAWGYRRLRGVEALGLGDAKLLAAAGAWMGPAALPSVVLWGAAVGLLQAGLLRVRGGRLAADTALPFGPGLAMGFWVTWLHGPLVLG